MRSTLLALTVFACSIAGEAAPDRYLCTIEKGYSLGGSGLARTRRILAALESRSFEIDRKTGAVTGSTLQNLSYEPTVVAPGDEENAFQVYWIIRSSSGMRVRFIEVQEYAETAEKPFRAVVQNWTYTGHCE